jgi:hypothetical protein
LQAFEGFATTIFLSKMRFMGGYVAVNVAPLTNCSEGKSRKLWKSEIIRLVEEGNLMTKQVPNPPDKSSVDDLHSMAKGAISCVPVVGGLVAELFQTVIVPPLVRRQQEWMEQIAAALNDLREKIGDFSWESLVNNETFTDVVLHASQLALRNHQAEKLVALRNAVCNTALNIDIDDTHKLIFLRYVDEFTVLHLKLLDLLLDPREWEKKNNQSFPTLLMGGISHIVEHAIPELSGENETYVLIIKDLQARGLLSNFNIGTTMSGKASFREGAPILGGSLCDSFRNREKGNDHGE